MPYKGPRLSIASLLEQAQAAPPPSPDQHAGIGLRHTAAGNAAQCTRLLALGDGPDALWRYIVLQSLDDYTSTLRRGGLLLAARFFEEEPRPPAAPRSTPPLPPWRTTWQPETAGNHPPGPTAPPGPRTPGIPTSPPQLGPRLASRAPRPSGAGASTSPPAPWNGYEALAAPTVHSTQNDPSEIVI